MLRTKIDSGLKELRLSIMKEIYKQLTERAVAETASYEQYLYWLIEQEQEERRVKRIKYRLEESKIPLSKTIEIFEMKRFPLKFGQQIQGLLTGDFIRQKENLLIFGNPGSGKTHLLAAIGQHLIYKYDMKIQFIQSSRLLQELLLAKKNLQLPKALKKLTNYHGLIIDDIGYVQQSKEEMDVLFTLISECYERTSILMTSNLPFSKWDQIFKDPMTAIAAIDRLIHHSVILEMNVSSYRMEKSKERKTAKN